MGIFALKKCGCVLFFLGGGGSQKGNGLYTHEKVDIYELSRFENK